MTSRRTRIKGIANIPQRNKTSQENSVSNVNTANNDNRDGNILHDNSESSINVPNAKRNGEQLTPHARVDLNIDCFIPSEKLPTIQYDTEASIKKLENPVECSIDLGNKSIFSRAEVTQTLSNSNIKVTDIAEEIHNSEITSAQEKQMENQKLHTSVVRRKFLKPGINLNAVKKRHPIKVETTESLSTIENTASFHVPIKQEILEGHQEKETSLKPSEKVIVISEIRIPKYESKPNIIACDITKIISEEGKDGPSDPSTLYSEVTLNETYLFVNEVPALNTPIVPLSGNIKKVILETHNVSDSEYPAPPPSPSKVNRSRIKAIPRLSQRKTSCSASESEDETRKYGRIRNNSVCSVVSTTFLEPPTPTCETVPPKDVMPILQKKIIRTEQSRKLAEARREFQKRFGANSPDKQRLKMIDLIFYNPTTNPMSQRSNKTSSENDITKIEKDSEEHVDDPSKVIVIEEKENDADSGMPVPQIKIGPSGEIILDEQSLIVENAEVVRQKEQIRNSQIVNGDFDTSYGIYKRAPRALAWNHKETLRFYKSLNLIGTDFTVMTQIFPKRTRRELKMKFKKEEKINKHLVDKAIMQPCSYNFADLKREIEIEEEEEATLQKLKEEEMKKMEQLKQLKQEKKRKDSDVKVSKNAYALIDEETVLPPKKRLKGAQKPSKMKPKLKRTKVKPLNIKSVLDDDSDADISDMDTQSESEEEETIPFLKPTRSGRMPKSTLRFTTVNEPPLKQFFNDTSTFVGTDEAFLKQSSNSTKSFTTPDDPPSKHSYNAIRNRRSSSLSSIESNSEKLIPGSVVIMTEEDSNGKSEYKVFMVTPNKKMAPLELDSAVIDRLVKERHSDENCSEFPEKNVTIPATEENDALV